MRKCEVAGMSLKRRKFIGNLITYGMVVAAFLVCQYLLQTGGMTRSLRGQLVPICVWVVMAVSLNLWWAYRAN